jgi:hypothetical protein
MDMLTSCGSCLHVVLMRTWLQSVVLMSHLGRPDGQPNPEYSLKPVADCLQVRATGEVRPFWGTDELTGVCDSVTAFATAGVSSSGMGITFRVCNTRKELGHPIH